MTMSRTTDCYRCRTEALADAVLVHRSCLQEDNWTEARLRAENERLRDRVEELEVELRIVRSRVRGDVNTWSAWTTGGA